MRTSISHITPDNLLRKLFFAMGLLWLCATPSSICAKVVKKLADPVITTDANTIRGMNSIYGSLNGSVSSSFKVSGTDIINGITITVPAGFEISIGGAYASTLVVGGSGTIAPTNVNIRLKLKAPVGTYSGNLVLTSGTTTVNMPILESVISKAPLGISRGNRIKKYGETLTDEVATDYNIQGLAAGETIGTVLVHYKSGAAATDPVKVYTGSVVASGYSGGTIDPNNYIINYKDADLFVVPINLDLVADDQVKYVGDPNPELTYHGIGFVNNETIAVIDKKPTIITTATVNSPPGKYPIRFSHDALTNNYNVINYVEGTLTILPERPPEITFTGAPSKLNTTYGTPSSSTSFTVSGEKVKDGGITVTAPDGYEVSTDDKTFSPNLKFGDNGTVNPTKVYLRLRSDAKVGTHSGNVVLSSGVTTVTVAVGSSEVTITQLTIVANVTKPYGSVLTNGPTSTGFTATGLKNGETIGTVTLTYTAGTAATDPLNTYPASVTPSAATGGTFIAANYNITYQVGDLVITPAPLTITAENKTRFFKDPDPVFTIKYSGFVNGETETVLTSQPVISTTATIASPIGKYPITISGAVAANYAITYVPGELTIASRAVMVANAFTPNGDGVNDTWDIQNITQYPNCTVDVFSRYGEKMFHSIGYAEAWTGQRNGTNLPVGTYYYIIKLDTSLKPLTGYLAIIR